MKQLMPRSTPSFLRPLDSYLHEINDTPLRSVDEELDLAWRVSEDGDVEAREHLVRANLRLVVNSAREHMGRGMAAEDLISDGNLGLLRAVEGFDPSRGCRFSTYAAYWIRQSMKRGLTNTARTVRLPAYAEEIMVRWRRASVALHAELGREASEEEVAAELGLSARKLKVARDALHIRSATYSQENATGQLLPSLPSGCDEPDAQMDGEDNVRQVLGLVISCRTGRRSYCDYASAWAVKNP
jgi:RNA polymerase primary sigma factor